MQRIVKWWMPANCGASSRHVVHAVNPWQALDGGPRTFRCRVLRHPGGAVADVPVRAHQRGATHSHLKPIGRDGLRKLAEVDGHACGTARRGSRLLPGVTQRPSDQHEIAIEPVESGMVAGRIQPHVRETRARAVGRLVVPRVQGLGHRAVGDDRVALVAEAEGLADAVQVVVGVLDPEGDAILVAGCDGILDQLEPLPVQEAEVGIRFRDRTALCLVRVQQTIRSLAVQHEAPASRRGCVHPARRN